MRMRLYLVTFEFVTGGDHGSLKARMNTLGARQLLEHQWAVRTSFTAAELKEIARQFIGEQDRVVVAEVGPERASRRALANLAEM